MCAGRRLDFLVHKTTTVYPGDIDSRSYYSDVTLKHTNIMKGYNELILQQRYQDASRYLYDNIETQNIDLEYNGAYIWNRIDTQLLSIEHFMYDILETNARPHYDYTAPSYPSLNTTWIA